MCPLVDLDPITVVNTDCFERGAIGAGELGLPEEASDVLSDEVLCVATNLDLE